MPGPPPPIAPMPASVTHATQTKTANTITTTGINIQGKLTDFQEQDIRHAFELSSTDEVVTSVNRVRLMRALKILGVTLTVEELKETAKANFGELNFTQFHAYVKPKILAAQARKLDPKKDTLARTEDIGIELKAKQEWWRSGSYAIRHNEGTGLRGTSLQEETAREAREFSRARSMLLPHGKDPDARRLRMKGWHESDGIHDHATPSSTSTAVLNDAARTMSASFWRNVKNSTRPKLIELWKEEGGTRKPEDFDNIVANRFMYRCSMALIQDRKRAVQDASQESENDIAELEMAEYNAEPIHLAPDFVKGGPYMDMHFGYEYHGGPKGYGWYKIDQLRTETDPDTGTLRAEHSMKEKKRRLVELQEVMNQIEREEIARMAARLEVREEHRAELERARMQVDEAFGPWQ